MKKLAVWALVLCQLTGCGGRVRLLYAREMGDTELIRTVGLDAWGSGVRLSASAGGQDTQVWSASGASVPAAAQALQGLGDGYVYYGHADRLLLGEEQVVRGLGPLMDYLAREAQLGVGLRLWVVRGGSAAQAMEQEGAGDTAQWDVAGEPGVAPLGRTAAQLMSVLACGGSTWIPALGLHAAQEGAERRVLVPDGYAVVRQGKLVGYADEEASRGIELMEGEGGGVVDLILGDGTRVSLRLDQARVVCRPVFREETLAGVNVACRAAAQVAQTERKLTGQEFEELERHLELLLGDRLIRVLELGQFWGADFLDLERRVQLTCPNKKRAIGEQWNEMFRALDLRATVQGRIERSYGTMERR